MKTISSAWKNIENNFTILISTFNLNIRSVKVEGFSFLTFSHVCISSISSFQYIFAQFQSVDQQIGTTSWEIGIQKLLFSWLSS